MRLACIYNVWDGVELLRGSMECRKYDVDLFVIVYQEVSNFGEKYNPLVDIDLEGFKNFILVRYEPNLNISGTQNEIAKRNLGIQAAKENNCTHFLFSDCDEYFKDFALAKYLYRKSGYGGSVCSIITYFKRPTLRLEKPDNYYVPFIHKLKNDSIAGVREYPFYVDPTRRVNEEKIIQLPIMMHHFSWVRKDIMKKVNNSSAKKTISKNNLLKDYLHPYLKAGHCLVDYQGQKLVDCPNLFNISL